MHGRECGVGCRGGLVGGWHALMRAFVMRKLYPNVAFFLVGVGWGWGSGCKQ